MPPAVQYGLLRRRWTAGAPPRLVSLLGLCLGIVLGSCSAAPGAPGAARGSAAEGKEWVAPTLTASWTSVGEQASAYFGTSVASAGDVNSDGCEDVLVGAPYQEGGSTEEGRAYLYLGDAAGLAATPSWTAEPDRDWADFGASVAGAGDVNGDGYADVVVGAPYVGPVVYLYLGGPFGLEADANWSVDGEIVASAGDVNGDGFGDVVVGYSSSDEGGRASVYLGSASGLDSTAAWTSQPDVGSASFGAAVASAGDVNADGFGDLIVGAPGYDGGSPDEGRVYLFVGGFKGLESAPTSTVEADFSYAWLGHSVAGAGDVDGDGYGDVLVGELDQLGGEPTARLYRGSAAGIDGTPAWSARPGLGYAIAAGDFDGDGRGDIAVGSPYLGEVEIYPGDASGPEAAAGWAVSSDQERAFFGGSLAFADVDGDGARDLVVGASTYDASAKDEGAAYVFPNGAAEADSGTQDTGTGPDSGTPPDTETPDTGLPNAAPEDTGLVGDTGPPDSGSAAKPGCGCATGFGANSVLAAFGLLTLSRRRSTLGCPPA